VSCTGEQSSTGTWIENNEKSYVKSNYQIPEDIQDVNDDIVDEVLSCQKCGKNYRFTPQEIEFHRKLNFALPRKCPECRYLERISFRAPKKLFKRDCMKCGKAIQTTYAPNRPETVYCGECYLKEIY